MHSERRKVTLINALVLALILFICPLAPALAITDADLYTARVAVADQSTESRNQALEAALAQVLRRVSGDQAAVLAGETLQPRALMQRYEYRRDEDAPEGLWLLAAFDESAIVRGLRDQGYGVWGRERPTTLVWLGVRDGVQRTVLSREHDGPVAQALVRASRAHGLPVMLPEGDEAERGTVEFIDLWGGFFETVEDASERYGAGSILAGRVDRDSGGDYRGRWTLLEQGRRRDWESHAGGLQAVINEGLAGLADIYIARFAIGADDVDRDVARIAVSGVGGLSDYARVLQYLEGLSPVDAVYVTRVAGDRLDLALVIQGSRERLDGVIGVGSVLHARDRVMVTVDESSARVGPDFHYALEH